MTQSHYPFRLYLPNSEEMMYSPFLGEEEKDELDHKMSIFWKTAIRYEYTLTMTSRVAYLFCSLGGTLIMNGRVIDHTTSCIVKLPFILKSVYIPGRRIVLNYSSN